ncbi:MAG: sodium:solute symporter family protein [Formivibrio sp.]|nr:sodium:solute symporter family protein [Formivibrio sp.]
MGTFGSMDTAIIIGLIAVYIIFTSWLTIKLRSKTSSEFMTGGRTTPAFVIGVLLMSEFIGAKSTVGVSQTAFESGMAATWAVLSAAVGFFLFGKFMAGRLHATGQITISGAIAQRYGRSTQLIVSLIMIYALLLVNVGNYVSGAAAVATITKTSLPVAALIIAIVSTFYFAFGGMKSVAYVSLLHTGLKYIGVFALLGTALYMSKGFGPVMDALPNFYFTPAGKVGWSSIIAFFIGNIGAIFTTQFIMQAISATKDARAARNSAYIAAGLCIPISIALGMIGVIAKFLFPEMKSLFALPIFMQHMNVFMAAMVAISLVASIFLGVSTVALAIASLIVKDFYVPMFKPTQEQEFKVTRYLSLAIGFFPLIFVFFAPGLLKLSFFTRALRLSIAVIAMIGFFLPFFSGNRGAIIGLLGSVVGTTVWYLLDNPYGIDNMYIALAIPAVVVFIEKLFHWNDRPPVSTEKVSAPAQP